MRKVGGIVTQRSWQAGDMVLVPRKAIPFEENSQTCPLLQLGTVIYGKPHVNDGSRLDGAITVKLNGTNYNGDHTWVKPELLTEARDDLVVAHILAEG